MSTGIKSIIYTPLVAGKAATNTAPATPAIPANVTVTYADNTIKNTNVMWQAAGKGEAGDTNISRLSVEELFTIYKLLFTDNIVNTTPIETLIEKFKDFIVPPKTQKISGTKKQPIVTYESVVTLNDLYNMIQKIKRLYLNLKADDDVRELNRLCVHFCNYSNDLNNVVSITLIQPSPSDLSNVTTILTDTSLNGTVTRIMTNNNKEVKEGIRSKLRKYLSDNLFLPELLEVVSQWQVDIIKSDIIEYIVSQYIKFNSIYLLENGREENADNRKFPQYYTKYLNVIPPAEMNIIKDDDGEATSIYDFLNNQDILKQIHEHCTKLTIDTDCDVTSDQTTEVLKRLTKKIQGTTQVPSYIDIESGDIFAESPILKKLKGIFNNPNTTDGEGTTKLLAPEFAQYIFKVFQDYLVKVYIEICNKDAISDPEDKSKVIQKCIDISKASFADGIKIHQDALTGCYSIPDIKEWERMLNDLMLSEDIKDPSTNVWKPALRILSRLSSIVGNSADIIEQDPDTVKNIIKHHSALTNGNGTQSLIGENGNYR